MKIYNKFKDNPSFTMYEVYHWEAHPSRRDDSHQFREIPGDWWYQQPFTKPDDLEHRIIHHECYMEAYPEIKIPGLVDDGPDGSNPKMNTGCIVSKKFKASYTSIYVVGLDGHFAYKSDWPPGPGGNVTTAKLWVDTTYKGLERILDEIVPPVSIRAAHQKEINKVINIHNNGLINITLPANMNYSIEIFNMKGKQVAVRSGLGSDKFTLADKIAAGIYMARLTSRKGVVTAPIVLKK